MKFTTIKALYSKITNLKLKLEDANYSLSRANNHIEDLQRQARTLQSIYDIVKRLNPDCALISLKEAQLKDSRHANRIGTILYSSRLERPIRYETQFLYDLQMEIKTSKITGAVRYVVALKDPHTGAYLADRLASEWDTKYMDIIRGTPAFFCFREEFTKAFDLYMDEAYRILEARGS